jgi:hypothetical protein
MHIRDSIAIKEAEASGSKLCAQRLLAPCDLKQDILLFY